ncbi:MAG TPA: sigma-70 family RNA polymerase sigma factor [Acidobacteriota bacterium]|nr:sigma-70 family RNA polymerase sigma factor [Acidobacteriota bacterium]
MSEKFREDPDVALMLRAAAGNQDAFEQLVVKYQRPVMNAAYRYTGNAAAAEELAQEVFIRVFRAAKNYRPEARFSTWLFTIVRNVCSNYRAREGKQDLAESIEAQSESIVLVSRHQDPQESVIRKEAEEKVQQAILTLPDSLRLPLVLHHFSNRSYEEIAAILDLSLSAVKVRIHRAKLALLEKLSEYMTKQNVTK